MLKPDFRLVKTSDGSDTLFSDTMNESYHSVNGAVQESMHVFIKNGLEIFVDSPEWGIKAAESFIKTNTPVNILEIGFGTGLNCLLTWIEAKKRNLCVNYETIEAFPLSKEITDSLNYGKILEIPHCDAFSKIHDCSWGDWINLGEMCASEFRLKKINADFTCYEPASWYDLVYYDAFAPNKQPDLWEEHLFAKIFNAMNPGGLLVTYCAMGEVRRRLQRSGFTTSRLPGPPGKREMLMAKKIL